MELVERDQAYKHIRISEQMNSMWVNAKKKTDVDVYKWSNHNYFLQPQNQIDRNRIISVYRSRVDACDRLWFVDTGALEYPSNTIQVQPPSIWIFDLKTDFLVRRFEIPTNNVIAGHGIASLTIDIDDNKCEDAYAYLPDLVNYRLHVYR